MGWDKKNDTSTLPAPFQPAFHFLPSLDSQLKDTSLSLSPPRNYAFYKRLLQID